MFIDDKDFFREATLKICGSLEIEVALWECLLYLRKILPVEMMFLNIYDPALGIIETVARADNGGGQTVSVKTILPDPSRRAFMETLSRPGEGSCLYAIPRIGDHEIAGPFSANFGVSDSAGLVMRPIVKGKVLGGVVLISHAGQFYSPEHVRLVGLLNEPFAIAISNYARFREIIRLKDILTDENRYLNEELRDLSGEKIVGANFGLKGVMDLVRQVAPLTSPVLLLGETGVGKEVIANAIHNWSPRSDKPFIKVNCGAIPGSLVDSELFGHEKGAFTGAITQKRGRFERAHQGTIFLDEIGDLPAEAQIRLLRVLQEKEIERVGGSEPIKVDIRVIAATHRDLETMLAEGRFREDLYFRIRVFPISIPPLRERMADIPALVQHFLQKKAKEMNLATIPPLVPTAMDSLMGYRWPGNVRELQNAVERELILSNGQPLAFARLETLSPAGRSKGAPEKIDGEPLSLNMAITRRIIGALEKADGKVEGPQGAARALNINPSTLRKKMKKLGIPFGRKAKKY